MDIIQMMYKQGWIAGQKYLKICREFVSKKNGFVILHASMVFCGLQTSEVPEYYGWLFSVISHSLERNPNLLDKVLELIVHGVHCFLQDAGQKNKTYHVLMERAISTGINYLPGYLSEKILEDNEIQSIYEKYYVNVI